jgi:hypothetical protein
MRPRQRPLKRRRATALNTPGSKAMGAWEFCLARNRACARGKFLLNA